MRPPEWGLATTSTVLSWGIVDLVHRGQGLDLLVAPAGVGLEQLVEALAQLLERLVVQVALGGGAQACDQVLDVLDEEPPVAPRVQIPGGGDQAVDDLVLELGDVAARARTGWRRSPGRVRPLVPPATLDREATSSSFITSWASLPPRLVSRISATDWPFEAMSWETAFSRLLLIWLISERVSRSLRSRSWALIRWTRCASPLSHSREATMRMSRIRPRVCWKPGFSLKRA